MGRESPTPTIVQTEASRVYRGEVISDPATGSIAVQVALSSAETRACSAHAPAGHYGLPCEGDQVLLTETATGGGVVEVVEVSPPGDAVAGEVGMIGRAGIVAAIIPGVTEKWAIRDASVLPATEVASVTAAGGIDAINISAAPGANKIAKASAAGKLAAGWGGAASTLATLDAGGLVVENPANATATPTASKIPIADGGGKLALDWIERAAGVPGAYPYAIPATVSYVAATAPGAGVHHVVELPTAPAAMVGHVVRICCTAAAGGDIEVDVPAAATLNGGAAGAQWTDVLTAVGDFVDCICVAADTWITGAFVAT